MAGRSWIDAAAAEIDLAVHLIEQFGDEAAVLPGAMRISAHVRGGRPGGGEELGGMRNLRVRDCVFIGTDVGLRFKSARDRGGPRD